MLCLGLAVFLSALPVWTLRQERQSRRAIGFLQQGGRLIDAATDAKSPAELSAAQVALSNFRGKLGEETQLADRGTCPRGSTTHCKADRRLRI